VTENSYANHWQSEATYPKGGYMDDFWIYSKKVLAKVSGSSSSSSSGSGHSSSYYYYYYVLSLVMMVT